MLQPRDVDDSAGSRGVWVMMGRAPCAPPGRLDLCFQELMVRKRASHNRKAISQKSEVEEKTVPGTHRIL